MFLDIELHKLEFKGQTVSSFVAELIDRAALEALDPFTVVFSTDIVKFGLHPRHKELVKDINDLRGFLYGAAKAKLGEVLAAKNNGTKITKLPLLLEIMYEQKLKLTQEDLDEVDLVDEFANFCLGFMDTTSHTILFASYFNLISPACQKKLTEEVNKTFKDTKQVTLDSLNQMEYMSAVIKETLRMCPPLPNFLPRQAVNDHQLGDLKIDAGTIVVAAGVTNSFDTDYHDEPEVFKPERWLDENSKTRKSVNKNSYIYIPFSTGARVCPGKEIGINLSRITLGLFMKKFEYALADKKYVMAFSAKLFSEPAEDLVYSIEAKN